MIKLNDVLETKKLVDKFLAWPLPKTVCSDLCVTVHNYPQPRSGTSLLTADEAAQMFEVVLSEARQVLAEQMTGQGFEIKNLQKEIARLNAAYEELWQKHRDLKAGKDL